MTGHEQPPTCTFCKAVMLGEYMVIGWAEICPKCFGNRRSRKADPSVVGWYLAGQSLAEWRRKFHKVRPEPVS